jgi:hypothetical protein
MRKGLLLPAGEINILPSLFVGVVAIIHLVSSLSPCSDAMRLARGYASFVPTHRYAHAGLYFFRTYGAVDVAISLN